ncbi:SRPBCC domain-containing protein [Kribbella qitaiheensis]|uniref:SRPBCC domain-containing protein n=2 Tax=Kribbella qitaiheensis TaxID=1544730 RepID=A0A7G6X6F3_9ACTN|nr:SRPBCC domain-containing protein [Kribbella qitaiheensis]
MTDEHKIEIEIPLDATPDEVWDAITTREGMTAWFFPMEVAPDENGVSPGGQMTNWEPGHGYTVVAGENTFEYLIEARDGGSAVLRFSQTGFTADDWEAEYEATARGWGLYFHTLALYLSAFKNEPATYVVAEGPESSKTAEAWQQLLSVLGASAVGDKVEITVPGLDPIIGEVDYLGPSHLGIHADRALLRFHDRSLLGIPVAIGHHYYGDQDADRLHKGWTSWLAAQYQ